MNRPTDAVPGVRVPDRARHAHLNSITFWTLAAAAFASVAWCLTLLYLTK